MATPFLCALFTAYALAAETDPTGLTLAGVVQDDQGHPLVGATVFISTAGPRQGVGIL